MSSQIEEPEEEEERVAEGLEIGSKAPDFETNHSNRQKNATS